MENFRFMIKKAPKDLEGYPFILKKVNKDGTACRDCPWYKFCSGCEIPVSDDVLDSLNEEETISVDWLMDRSDMFFYRPETKDWLVEHPSLQENREAQDRPISFIQCMEWFTQTENLDNEVFCSQCNESKKASKKWTFGEHQKF